MAYMQFGPKLRTTIEHTIMHEASQCSYIVTLDLDIH